MNLRAPTADFAVAQRVAHLGTETVFAVSAEAAALAAQGKTVYPFHLGDLNIATPENIVEASLRGDPRRQDHLLPQRRHPAAARGPGRGREPRARPGLRGARTSPCSPAASR